MNNDDSLIEELENFKIEGSNFKFDIPQKYEIPNNLKLVKEEVRKDGSRIKCFENSLLEIKLKNNTLNRIFPDGYSITYYANKDIKQVIFNN